MSRPTGANLVQIQLGPQADLGGGGYAAGGQQSRSAGEVGAYHWCAYPGLALLLVCTFGFGVAVVGVDGVVDPLDPEVPAVDIGIADEVMGVEGGLIDVPEPEGVLSHAPPAALSA